MGFDIKVVTDCLGLNRKQVLELLFTIILPVTAGVAFIASLWPALIKDGRTLNICLLGFVAALPVVLINNVVWSLLFLAFLERVIKIVAISFVLSSPVLRKSETARKDVQEDYAKAFNEMPLFDDIRLKVVSSFDLRDIASVVTAIGFYSTAIFICLFKPGAIVSALVFLVVAILPAICSVVIANWGFSQLESKLSTMTPHEIIEQVTQFADQHCPPATIEQMKSFLYAFLDGDRTMSLSEILTGRMQMTDRLFLEREESQED